MWFIEQQVLLGHVILQSLDLALLFLLHAVGDAAGTVDFALLEQLSLVVISESGLF